MTQDSHCLIGMLGGQRRSNKDPMGHIPIHGPYDTDLVGGNKLVTKRFLLE
jgi:hypothetical protein